MKLKNTLKDIRKNVYVRNVMSKEVLRLDKEESVYEAIKVMANKSISTIVTSHGTTPIGILTERDLVKKMLLKNKDPKNTTKQLIERMITKENYKMLKNDQLNITFVRT